MTLWNPAARQMQSIWPSLDGVIELLIHSWRGEIKEDGFWSRSAPGIQIFRAGLSSVESPVNAITFPASLAIGNMIRLRNLEYIAASFEL